MHTRHAVHIPGVIGIIGLCAAIATSGGCATSALFEQELIKTNTQTVLAFEATLFNKHEVQEAFDHYVAVGFAEHDPHLSGEAAGGAVKDVAASDAPDRAAAMRAYRTLLADCSPASYRSFERTIAQGDLVAAQSLWDRRPGRARALHVVDIYRLREGRIVEHWDVVQDDGGG